MPITDTNIYCISLVIDYIINRRNPFKFFKNNNNLANIAEQTKVNRESVQFLLKITESETEMYRKYHETCFQQKSAKLFNNITKTRKTTKVGDDVYKYDLKKETGILKENQLCKIKKLQKKVFS